MKVLERKDLTSDSTSADYLSMICASAVRESLTNVFGQKFDAFTANFEKSFGSTLSTIRLIRDTENDNREQLIENHKVTICSPDRIPAVDRVRVECSRSNDITECCTKPVNHDCKDSRNMESNGDVDDHVTIESKDRELSTQGLVSWQLARSNQGCLNNSVISTIEKSVSEQTRANDLKSIEIGLVMKKLQLKETQLALNSDSNVLERCKLSLGISRTSFKVEKFKTQLEETKYGELLKTCADYLVTGLIIMCCCLSCGVYAFSYDNLRLLTKSCHPPEGSSSSWWRPMASFNTGWQTLSCQVQVYSRIIFGGLMIGAIGLALIQRSDIARQGMPITFIVLLLAVLCGMVGKVCVDTLGGDGYTWLVLWEALCTIHFFATIFNQSLHRILYGTVQVSQAMKSRSLFPFWVRRWLFYLFLIALPVCCGLLPFASASTWWEDHISVFIRNRWSAAFSEPFDAEMRE